MGDRIHSRNLALSEDARRRLVEALDLRVDHYRRIAGCQARDEIHECRLLQDRLDPTGRWCEALDESDETLDDQLTA